MQTSTADAADATFSIRVVEAKTGIPAETLRIWERRYGFPKPARRPGGARVYRREDVARLQLIAAARAAGYRPADLLGLGDAELRRLNPAGAITSEGRAVGAELDAMLDELRNDRVEALRARLRKLSVTLGPRAFVTDVAQPVVARVIGSFMGTPEEDDVTWARIMNTVLAPDDKDLSPDGIDGILEREIPEIFERCGKLIAERRETPTDDLTVQGTYYSKQGFLGEAEWRQRFDNGGYTIKAAGISQNDPEAFDANTVNSGLADDPTKFRGMMGTKGQFAINERWNFGWDVLLQTDKNFSSAYGIDGFDDSVHRSEVYLTGLNDRNYFDLRAQHFEVQENVLNKNAKGVEIAGARADKQPWVLPSLDYAYIPETSVAGGQLTFNLNPRLNIRNKLDEAIHNGDIERVRGIEGDSGRLTGEAEWKKTIITDGGLVITPLLAFQADVDYANASSDSLTAINEMAENDAIKAAYPGVSSDFRSSFARYMATAGLELRYPILFSAIGSSHVIEPMAQLFVRPNEQYVGGLKIPNEDAQSFVFDAATLIERDKFSGYDRIEGGTRANLGFRYSGSYDNGWATNAIFGQSYQLGGRNSFVSADLVNAGANSGLETDTSDYVGLVGVSSPNGFSASLSGRFDEQSFDVRRMEAKTGFSAGPLSLTARYAFIENQPLYGFNYDRREVSLAGSTRLDKNWRLFGTGTYDIEHSVMTSKGFGFSYSDECFTYMMTFSETKSFGLSTENEPTNIKTSTNIGFNLSFRTLGDFGSATSAFAEN